MSISWQAMEHYEYYQNNPHEKECNEDDDEDDYEDERPFERSNLKFKDLKVGMKFRLYSEDSWDDYSEGKIETIFPQDNGGIAVQFDDENGVYTWAFDAEQQIHDFMEPLDE